MSFYTYIRRGLRYIFKGEPVKQYLVNIVTLPPNEIIKGRTALITGGTSGIGYCIAKAFASAGAFVVITGRDEIRINNAIRKIKSETNSELIKGIVLNNRNVSSFDSKIEEIESLVFPHTLDILVNNAGVGGDVAVFPRAKEDDYDTIMETNLKGAFFLSQSVAIYMKNKQIAGNILNIASSSSLRPANSAYILSKWGLRSLTLGLAKSLIKYDIVVNGIAPGPTLTPFVKDEITDDITNKDTPTGRFTAPEEVANMAVILVSNMGRSVVGDIVYMTGGSGLITIDDACYQF